MSPGGRRLDLVVQWPSTLDIDRLTSLRHFPVYAHPRMLDTADATIWVASNGALVAKFRLDGVGPAKPTKLLSGRRAPKGRNLGIQLGSVRILSRPKPIAQLPCAPGATRNPGYPDGFLYLGRRPRQFVRTGRPQAGSVKSTSIGLEKRHLEAWIQESRAQHHRMGERVHHAAEARLVLAYNAWLADRHPGARLIRHAIELPDGSQILSDAYVEYLDLLIEAKSSTDRPTIRMAIGQLLDYAQALPSGIQRAVLVPHKPTEDLITLLRSLRIHAIWQTEDGAFADSARGKFVR